MSIELNTSSSSYPTSPTKTHTTSPIQKDEIPPLGGNNKSESPLTEAIRLYRNYVLTGVKELTSEEKEEVKSLIDDYLKEHNFLEKYQANKASSDDYAALNHYIQGLYRQFGCKGDYYTFMTDFIDETLDAVTNPNNPPNPPFKVMIPPEDALTLRHLQKKPMLMPFQSPSPHQFLMADDNPK